MVCLLENAFFMQDRAKIQQVRRRPTRKGRAAGAASQQAADDGTGIADPDVASQSAAASTRSSARAPAAEPSKQAASNKKPLLADVPDNISNASDDDDIFKSSKNKSSKHAPSSQQTKNNMAVSLETAAVENAMNSAATVDSGTSEKVTSWLRDTNDQPHPRAASKSIFEEAENDDENIFSTSNVATGANTVAQTPGPTITASTAAKTPETVTTSVVTSGFKEPPPLKISSVDDVDDGKPAAPNLFSSTKLSDDDDDDLFGSRKRQTLASKVTKAPAAEMHDDDLFAATATTSRPRKPVAANFLDDDDDDIFASSSLLTGSNKSRDKAARDIDDIFDVDDDPLSPKAKTTGIKTTIQAAPAEVIPPTTGDDDDIFSDAFNAKPSAAVPKIIGANLAGVLSKSSASAKLTKPDNDDIIAQSKMSSAKPAAASNDVDDDIFSDTFSTQSNGELFSMTVREFQLCASLVCRHRAHAWCSHNMWNGNVWSHST